MFELIIVLLPAIFTAFLFPMLILAISYVQKSSIEKQKNKLENIEYQFECADPNDEKQIKIKQSKHYLTASNYYNNLSSDGFLKFSNGYKLPMVIMTSIVLLFAIGICFGHQTKDRLSDPTYYLGGMFVSIQDESDDGQLSYEERVADYQNKTYIAFLLSFIGSYITILYKMVRRINNFDIAPMAYYFYTLHFIQAGFIAIAFRHFLELSKQFGVSSDMADSTISMAVVGFVIGMKPDFFMLFIVRKVMEKIDNNKKSNTDIAVLPSSLNLSMIEGLTEEKRSRLLELDIDTSQHLAQCNPFFIYTKTSFRLSQIVDWIAQAQLHVLVKDDRMHKLRAHAIRDIQSFLKAAASEAQNQIANILNTESKILDSIVQAEQKKPEFIQLKEVKIALKSGTNAEPNCLSDP